MNFVSKSPFMHMRDREGEREEESVVCVYVCPCAGMWNVKRMNPTLLFLPELYVLTSIL